MATIEELKSHRRVTVMGLGLFGGGVGAARFWSGLGAQVTVTDLKDRETLAPSVAALADTGCRLILGEHREEDFRDTDLVVVNPAVKPENQYIRLARAAGVPVVTEIGLLLRLAKGPVLAVTGSNGKSTTTSLLGAMVRAHEPAALIGGNLGGSLLEKLSGHRPSAPLILELSSFQLHYLKGENFAPRAAVVTNLSPNHLDWHRTTLSYYEDKRLIVAGQTADDCAVLNAEDETLRAWAKECPARVILTARRDPESADACFVRERGGERWIVCRLAGKETELAPLSLLRLPGEHNVQNALQAAAAAFDFTADAAAVAEGMSRFDGLPHRLERVGEAGGVKFVNDSIATTPESAVCGLEAFACPVVLLAGGYDKGQPFDALGRSIVERAHALVLIGKTAPAIREAVVKALAERPAGRRGAPPGGMAGGPLGVQAGPAIEAAGRLAQSGSPPGGMAEEPIVIEAGTEFEAAVRLAKSVCPPGGVVLLSPACASYDMFKNFEQRGEIFRQIVAKLVAEE